MLDLVYTCTDISFFHHLNQQFTYQKLKQLWKLEFVSFFFFINTTEIIEVSNTIEVKVELVWILFYKKPLIWPE